MKKNLLEGSILRNLIFLSAPIILANFLQVAYQLTDTFWIGRLSEDAVASLSLSFPITLFFMSIAMGFAMAGGIIVAQYVGKNDQRMVNKAVGQTLFLALIVSLCFSVIGYLITPWVIGLMGVTNIVASGAISYLQVYFIGNIFVFGFVTIQFLFRGIGQVIYPLIIVAGTVLINLIIDPLFINGYGIIPALGIKGASLATCITQFFAFIISLFLLIRGNLGLKLDIKSFKLDPAFLGRIFKLGLPSSLEMSSRALGMITLSFIVASFGTTIIAAYGIGSQIFGLVMLPAMGVAMAVGTMVGQGLGAKKMDFVDETARLGLRFIGGAMILISFIIYYLAAPLSSALILDSPLVVSAAVNFLRIISVSFVFVGLLQVSNGIFQAAGKTMLSMRISLLALWGVHILPAYFLSHYTSLEENGIWWTYLISFSIASFVALGILFKGDWKHGSLLEKIKSA